MQSGSIVTFSRSPLLRLFLLDRHSGRLFFCEHRDNYSSRCRYVAGQALYCVLDRRTHRPAACTAESCLWRRFDRAEAARSHCRTGVNLQSGAGDLLAVRTHFRLLVRLCGGARGVVFASASLFLPRRVRLGFD